MRWVWPASIASTVVSWSASAIVDDRAVPRRPAALPSTGFCPMAVPSWITTTWTLTPCCAQPLGLGLDPSAPRRRNVSPAVAPARDQLGRVLQLDADHADLHAVDGEDRACPAPSRGSAGRRLDDVGAPGTGSWPAPGAAAAGRRRSRTRGCRRTWRPGPRRSRRRWPACPRAGRSSAGEAPTLSPEARRSAVAGQLRGLLVEHRRQLRRAADRHVRCRRSVSVVGSSWPWKSVRPTIETSVQRLAALERRPGSTRALAVLRLGDAQQVRDASAPGRSCAGRSTVALGDAVAAGDERRAHVDVGGQVLHVRHVAVLAEEGRAGDQRARASPRRTGTAGRRRRPGRRCGSGAPCRRCCPGRSGCSAPRPW